MVKVSFMFRFLNLCYPVCYLRVAVTQPGVVTQGDPVILTRGCYQSQCSVSIGPHLETLQEEGQVPGDSRQEVVVHLEAPLRTEAQYLGVQPGELVVGEDQSGDLFVIALFKVK